MSAGDWSSCWQGPWSSHRRHFPWINYPFGTFAERIFPLGAYPFMVPLWYIQGGKFFKKSQKTGCQVSDGEFISRRGPPSYRYPYRFGGGRIIDRVVEALAWNQGDVSCHGPRGLVCPPKMLLRWFVYGYLTHCFSSRRINQVR